MSRNYYHNAIPNVNSKPALTLTKDNDSIIRTVAHYVLTEGSDLVLGGST